MTNGKITIGRQNGYANRNRIRRKNRKKRNACKPNTSRIIRNDAVSPSVFRSLSPKLKLLEMSNLEKIFLLTPVSVTDHRIFQVTCTVRLKYRVVHCSASVLRNKCTRRSLAQSTVAPRAANVTALCRSPLLLTMLLHFQNISISKIT